MITPVGDIKDLTVPLLFQDLRTEMKTGTLIFAHDTAVKKVYFQKGDIIFASSNLDADRLGDYLLGIGKLTQAQFDASTELIKKTGKRQGTILVELGFISPQDLVAGVKTQVKQIILSLFSWRNGRYIFDDSPLPLSDIILLQMSTGNLIIEGVRELDWQVVRKSLPPLKTVLRPASDPSHLFQCADLSPDQTAVFSLVDGNKTMQELCTLSGQGDFNTLKAIYVLLSLRMVEVGEIKAEREKQFVRKVVGENIITPQQTQAAPDTPLSMSEARVIILKAFEELEKQDHYQVLGVTSRATDDEIRKAYFRLAKIYHPDRHYEPEMADLKKTLEALFTRIHTAYEALNTQSERNKYNMLISSGTAKVKDRETVIEKKSQAAEQFNNGMKDYKIGNFWGAVEAFRWACQFAPENSEYLFYKGLSLSRIPRRNHEAEEDLRNAIGLDPTNGNYYLELGNLYLKTGMKSRAAAVFSEGLQAIPGSERLQKALTDVEGEQSADKAEDKDKSGLFKKMFKGKDQK